MTDVCGIDKAMEDQPTLQLSARLSRLHEWMNEQSPAGEMERRHRLPGLRVTIDPSRETEFPSNNGNTIEILAHERWNPGAFDDATAMLRRAGITRAFAWLSPCADQEEIPRHLGDRGWKKFERTTYPVLALQL